VSVIMPVLDGEAHVADQLAALAGQTYAGDWELVVADNGCRDGTIDIVRGMEPQLPPLVIADARARRGLNHARNVGAQAARGDLLAFCDCDDVVSTGWLEAMARAARRADVVGGRLEAELLNDATVRAWRPSEPMTELVREQGYLPYAAGGNMAVWTQVARAIGWDEEFRFGSSDSGFAWQAQMAGYTLAFAPDALVHQRYRRTIRATARQYYHYGASGPQLYRTFRAHGMPAPDNRDALRRWRRLAHNAPDLWRSRAQRGAWIRTASFRLGRVAGSIRARVICL
jgi:glycosyltransferase involved in cell wall biosynthesis